MKNTSHLAKEVSIGSLGFMYDCKNHAIKLTATVSDLMIESLKKSSKAGLTFNMQLMIVIVINW